MAKAMGARRAPQEWLSGHTPTSHAKRGKSSELERVSPVMRAVSSPPECCLFAKMVVQVQKGRASGQEIWLDARPSDAISVAMLLVLQFTTLASFSRRSLASHEGDVTLYG